MEPFDDPYYSPRADIHGRDARAYEEKILELLRAAFMPSPGPLCFFESIELRGEQPDTEVVIRTRDPSEPAVRRGLWHRDPPGGYVLTMLDDAASVAGWIYADWMSGRLDPVDPK